MSTFIALYRGRTVSDAHLVAVSADPHLVAYVSGCLLQLPPSEPGQADPVVGALERGRRRALRLVRREATDTAPQTETAPPRPPLQQMTWGRK
jgi:hypothetical protein